MASVGARYIGRFAPSPTGPLHAGSLVAALASWLDARAHGGQWLVRIEDVDTPRCVAGAADEILRQLAALGLHPDAPPAFQSQRGAHYQTALDTLVAGAAAYPCTCSRKDIAAAWQAQGGHKQRHGELVYPGTCRHGLPSQPPKSRQAWRFACPVLEPNSPLTQGNAAQAAIKSVVNSHAAHQLADTCWVTWQDRVLGQQQQNVAAEVGDFVLLRADGLWAYQLAVVVDDALQGITHVVRGADLADNTARQILLQRALGYPQPQYLHTPLVLAVDGQKLSKQNGAAPLDTLQPAKCLREAATYLDLHVENCTNEDLLAIFLSQWRRKHL